ncbi:MAG: RsmB/NOP family class I SAM-dependent RNA methyltransferase [Hyphomicrobiales bacterium]
MPNDLKKKDYLGYKARELAVDVLLNITQKNINTDQSFDFYLSKDKYKSLPKEDLAFSKNIIMTTLRYWGFIEKILDKYLSNSIEEHSPRIHIILLISITQIIVISSPPYAVVNIAINLTKRDRKSYKLQGLVNAVLRKISREIEDINLKEFDANFLLPDWLRSRWHEQYNPSEILSTAQSLLTPPPLDITVKQPESKLVSEINGVTLNTGTIRLFDYGFIPDIKYYSDGEWWVQDVSASIPVKLIENEIKGMNFVDFCAAPGGKTANLIQAGAIVTAIDSSKERIKVLEQNLRRLKYKAEIIHADASVWSPKKPYDGVLIDAPCSSTGVIRRNPDILRRKDFNLDYFVSIQEKLLRNGLDIIKKGGILVYCTCSMEKEEGEDQIKKILSERADVNIKEIDIEKISIVKKYIKPEGYVRIIPNTLADGGNDGFFISILQKT